MLTKRVGPLDRHCALCVVGELEHEVQRAAHEQDARAEPDDRPFRVPDPVADAEQ